MEALVGRPEGKKVTSKPRLIWKDNIKMNLKELGLKYVTMLIWLVWRHVSGLCEDGN
jgi:hypothetical protein